MKYPYNPNLSGGNYTGTRTEACVDKTGALYMTSMGSPNGGTGFGINLWRIPPNKPAQLLMNFPGDHGSLHILNKQLVFVRNGANRSQTFTLVPGYIHPDDSVSGTTVNINDAQLNTLNQQISTALRIAGAADTKATATAAQMTKLLAEVASLRKRVEALESGAGSGTVNEQKIADIVWAKLWDAFYLIRMGMNAGISKDPNIQGWINDLESFIKRVK
jgi:hypothetical protein